MRTRVWSIGARVALVVAVIGVTGCGRGTAPRAEPNADSGASTTTVAPSPELVRFRADLHAAVDALDRLPGVQIVGEDRGGDGDPSTVRIVTDPAASVFDSVEHLTGGVDYHRVLIGDRLYVGAVTGGAPTSWSSSPVDGSAYYGGAFTFHGRVFADLPALLTIVDSVDFTLERRPSQLIDGRPATGYRLSAPAVVVLDALIRLGLTTPDGAEANPASAPVTLTLWLGDTLVGLDASGSVFHDGEAVQGEIDLRYDALGTAPTITAPDVSGGT
jgi:hypothetical protein